MVGWVGVHSHFNVKSNYYRVDVVLGLIGGSNKWVHFSCMRPMKLILNQHYVKNYIRFRKSLCIGEKDFFQLWNGLDPPNIH